MIYICYFCYYFHARCNVGAAHVQKLRVGMERGNKGSNPVIQLSYQESIFSLESIQQKVISSVSISNDVLK